MFSSRSRDVRFQRFCLEYRHTLKDIDAVIDGVVKIEQNSIPLGIGKIANLDPASRRYPGRLRLSAPPPKLPASGALFCYLQGA